MKPADPEAENLGATRSSGGRSEPTLPPAAADASSSTPNEPEPPPDSTDLTWQEPPGWDDMSAHDKAIARARHKRRHQITDWLGIDGGQADPATRRGAELVRAAVARAHEENEARRAKVLAHPAASKMLTYALPHPYRLPVQWNGYIPAPYLVDTAHRGSEPRDFWFSSDRYESPQRLALLDIVAIAETESSPT